MTEKQLQKFIQMLRKEQITWTTLTIGTLHIDGATDLKLADSRSRLPGARSEPPQTIFEKYGGELLKQPESPVDSVPDEAKLDD